MEELEEMHVARLAAEVLLQQPVDGGLEHERVVHSDQAYTFGAVPARLAAPGGACVHEVVRDEEDGLELWTINGMSAAHGGRRCGEHARVRRTSPGRLPDGTLRLSARRL